LKYRSLENEVFALVSVGYTITDFQNSETVKYITRGAKWSDVKYLIVSTSKSEK